MSRATAAQTAALRTFIEHFGSDWDIQPDRRGWTARASETGVFALSRARFCFWAGGASFEFQRGKTQLRVTTVRDWAKALPLIHALLQCQER